MRFSLDFISDDVLLTIIAKVTSTSQTPIEDLKRLRESCKRLRGVCRQSCVLKLVLVNRIAYNYWSVNGMLTVRWLASAGNLEALFIQAIAMVG